MSSNTEKLVAALCVLANLFGQKGDDERKQLDKCYIEVIQLFGKLKPRSANVTRILAALRADETLSDDLIVDMWDDWLEILRTLPVEEEQFPDKDVWIELFVMKDPARAGGIAPLPGAQPPAPREPDRDSKSIKNLGITLKLPRYAGEIGKCAKWWRETVQTLEGMNLADDHYFVVVLDLLDGDAREEFWQRLETLVESKVVSRPYVLKDVKLVVII